ncbi:MAG: WbqC family protein [Thermodesulfobacteriota bacterium]|nr:WbqC family protein [Thermodesulfobacteriota bacterium]
MIVTIHQPQYLPWLGYFDKIDKADIFVILDNVQYKKNEWQNRNRIKIANGWQWLSVPVLYKFPQKINQVRINNGIDWRRKHLNALSINYGKSLYLNMYRSFLEDVFLKKWEYLVDINIYCIEFFIKTIGIDTKLLLASKLKLRADPTHRLIDICKEVEADTYLAGKDGGNYMDIESFEKENINVLFQEFQHPIYNQLFGKFEPNMSVIDLLLNYGKESLNIIRGN